MSKMKGEKFALITGYLIKLEEPFDYHSDLDSCGYGGIGHALATKLREESKWSTPIISSLVNVLLTANN